MFFLISLSENDKRLIFALLIVLILLFVLIGYIGFLVTKLMKWQGRKMDTLTADPVVTRVITNRRHYIRYARKKNWRLFFKQSYVAILILFSGAATLIIRDAIMRDFTYNVFDYEITGFNTVLFLWDFSGCIKREGLSIVLNWPVLINTPHFSVDAIISYIFMTCMIVGGLWYLISLQSLIARTIRMYVLSTKVFEKTLDGFNQNSQYSNLKNPMPSQSESEPEEIKKG